MNGARMQDIGTRVKAVNNGGWKWYREDMEVGVAPSWDEVIAELKHQIKEAPKLKAQLKDAERNLENINRRRNGG